MPFLSILAQNEMPTASFRIWTRVEDFICLGSKLVLQFNYYWVVNVILTKSPIFAALLCLWLIDFFYNMSTHIGLF